MNIISDNLHHEINNNNILKALELMDNVFPIICYLQILIRGNKCFTNDHDGLPDYLVLKVKKIIKLLKESDIKKYQAKKFINNKYYDDELLSDYIDIYWN